jgi:hypothetical protein
MKSPAPRGGKTSDRAPSAGLLTAWKRLAAAPDPAGLNAIGGRNREALRLVAKLLHLLCDGTPGTRFHLGSEVLATLLGTHQRTAHRWVQRLEALGVVVKTWNGRRCRKDYFGKPLPGGRTDNRASEFVFMGLPKSGV